MLESYLTVIIVALYVLLVLNFVSWKKQAELSRDIAKMNLELADQLIKLCQLQNPEENK